MLVSTVEGSERVLSPGTDVVLEVVRMAMNEQFPTLMPTLYPSSKETDPGPYVSFDATWRAFSDLAHNKTPAVNVEIQFSLPVSSTGTRSFAPYIYSSIWTTRGRLHFLSLLRVTRLRREPYGALGS